MKLICILLEGKNATVSFYRDVTNSFPRRDKADKRLFPVLLIPPREFLYLISQIIQ